MRSEAVPPTLLGEELAAPLAVRPQAFPGSCGAALTRGRTCAPHAGEGGARAAQELPAPNSRVDCSLDSRGFTARPVGKGTGKLGPDMQAHLPAPHDSYVTARARGMKGLPPDLHNSINRHLACRRRCSQPMWCNRHTRTRQWLQSPSVAVGSSEAQAQHKSADCSLLRWVFADARPNLRRYASTCINSAGRPRAACAPARRPCG